MGHMESEHPEVASWMRVYNGAGTEQPCKYGNCVEFVDEDGEVWGGFGPADCPCADEED